MVDSLFLLVVQKLPYKGFQGMEALQLGTLAKDGADGAVLYSFYVVLCKVE